METENNENENLTMLAALAGDVRDVGHPWVEDEFSFLKLQEANNISRAAYFEIMKKALDAKTWVEAIPALGSIGDCLRLLRCVPPTGMRVECSVESAVLPVASHILVAMMVDVEEWASVFCHIVHCGSSSSPTGILGKLNNAGHSMLNVQVVNAELHLPTPFVKNRKSCFLRWRREVIPGVWAILDLGCDYFPYWPSDCTLEPNCRKKPSGVIIRPREENSEVIWIENVEVNEGQAQDNIYTDILNSDFAFSARHWVKTLLWKLKRAESNIFNAKIEVNEQANTLLLELTDLMKMVYLRCVNSVPDSRNWVILYDQGIRILGMKAANLDDMSKNYTAVTSFCIQADPSSVFDFLVKKNLDIQWRNSLGAEKHEEVIKLSNYHERNSITLHRKITEYMDSTKITEYLLQEASRDEFCSYIISAPMTELEVTEGLLRGRWRDIFLQPSGFAIMPARFKSSNASLVTIALQQQFDGMEMGPVIESLSNLINTIIVEIASALTDQRNEE